MKTLTTIILLISVNLVFADIKAQKVTLLCEDKLTKDGAIVLKTYSVDLAGKTGVLDADKRVVADQASLDAASKELWNAILVLPSIKAVAGFVTHISIPYSSGTIEVNLKTGEVRWPKVTIMDEKTRAFLDAVVLSYAEVNK